MSEGFRVHIIIPRIDPQRVGLSSLYHGIENTKPHAGVARHMIEDDLVALHPKWYPALRILAKEGYVEWRVSHRIEDLPHPRTLFVRSA